MSARCTLTVHEEHGARPGLVNYVENVYAAVSGIPDELRLPVLDLSVVLTGDVTASIRQRGQQNFRPERVGGIVAGKTLALSRDSSRTLIVLDTGPADAEPDAFDSLMFIHLLGHELGHAFLARLRAVAGALPVPAPRDQTPAEAAAILAYKAADEYRCDLFSNHLLTSTLSLHLGDVFEDGYRAAFSGALDSVHPGWPDLIRSHHRHEITIEDMFGQLVRQTDAMLILVAHADAVEQAAGHNPLLAEHAAHPGTHTLLAPAWNPLRAVLDRTPIIPTLADFADVDRTLQDCGRHITDIWAALGVRGHLTDDNELHLTAI
ncbi:hypothetical protein ACIRL0_12020 [Streptomyces sp. NPDC102365]|uniref:hypothetical protein n=1 Tax=Streptomyces sp. NPDC102365 TaxID=3366162 RepID=UPI00381E6BFE